MSLRLTPDCLAGSYEYLRTTSPFKGMGLPEADDVGFIVSRHSDRYSHMNGYIRSQEAEIAISEKLVGSTLVLMVAMAHEMLHLHQHIKRTETPNCQHNAEFRRLAKIVCRTHLFDPKTF